ncbi:MAG: magnesium transporter [Candidatus Izemoplasmatales bacterium]|jgi:magnesium transporter|nr:magnesium transporter [Candidatus Izemoplasmatales bacterium]
MNEETDLTQSFEAEILSILHSDSSPENKISLLDEYHDYELSQTLLAMTHDDRHRFFLLFKPDVIANIIAQLAPHDVIPILNEMHLSDAGKILNEMQGDDLVDLLQAFASRDERVTFLSLINIEKRNSIKRMIDYDETVVGSIMNNNYVEIDSASTVKAAIKTLVQSAPKVEFVNNIYITENHLLTGVLSLKEIISAGNQPDRPIADIMTINLISVFPTTPKAEAIQLMKDYDFYLLPVIDHERMLLGVISFDDITEAIDTESDTDYAKLAAVSDITINEDAETVFTTVKKRFPWLIVLLAFDLGTSSIVAGFGATLTALPMLALFMPLILNMAGNTGTQSLGVIIGLFSRNKLNEKKTIWQHLLKEMLVGIFDGLVIGILLFAMVLGIKTVGGSTFSEAFPFALVIGTAIAVALAVSTLSGAVVPLIVKLFKIDPAVASGPFITTIDDIVALVIYFGLAILMLGNLL